MKLSALNFTFSLFEASYVPAFFHAAAKLHSLSLQEGIILMSWRDMGLSFDEYSLRYKLSLRNNEWQI